MSETPADRGFESIVNRFSASVTDMCDSRDSTGVADHDKIDAALAIRAEVLTAHATLKAENEQLQSELATAKAKYTALADATIQELGEETVGDTAILEIARLGKHNSALERELTEAKAAIRNSPETYQYVSREKVEGCISFGHWTGEECCWFCDGELANQSVNHKPDCIWTRYQL